MMKCLRLCRVSLRISESPMPTASSTGFWAQFCDTDCSSCDAFVTMLVHVKT